MNPDGTGQTEFYGNNSWFPTTILHARGIPGTEKIVAVLGAATVHADGSACFRVPARAPVYFQALDSRGCAVQSMRSWSTCNRASG